MCLKTTVSLTIDGLQPVLNGGGMIGGEMHLERLFARVIMGKL